jgi:hypothetical protein
MAALTLTIGDIAALQPVEADVLEHLDPMLGLELREIREPAIQWLIRFSSTVMSRTILSWRRSEAPRRAHNVVTAALLCVGAEST